MDTIKSTIHENLTNSHWLASEDDKFSLDQVPDLEGKVAVVTGGSQGIGYGCTHTLLKHNIAKLFILSQSPGSAADALAAIRAELGAAAAARVQWAAVDLADWAAVARAAQTIAAGADRLDILINNAAKGIAHAAATAGVDEHMAVNHVGHVVLTSHLLPLMKKTADAGATVRIVNFGSNAHPSAPEDTKFGSLEEINRDHGPTAQYGRSKLAAMLYSRWLATHLTSENSYVFPLPPYLDAWIMSLGAPKFMRAQPVQDDAGFDLKDAQLIMTRSRRILANSIHPGIVDTKATTHDIHEAYPLGGYGMSILTKPFQKSQFEGCVPAMYAATVTDRSGKYICAPARIEDGSELARNNELAESLMALTEKLVREKSEAVKMGCPLKFY